MADWLSCVVVVVVVGRAEGGGGGGCMWRRYRWRRGGLMWACALR